MKRNFKIAALALIFSFGSLFTQAGNPDRAGQAGATQLLINGWARSSGWGLANTAGVRGIESFQLNIAGLAHTEQTEVIFARTAWLRGSDINLNTFGLSQKVGETGVLGIGLMSMDIANIQITTTEQPDGGLGTFRPNMMNMGVAYSKKFSESISGGVLVRIVSESITDVKAMGFGVDAGVQYVTSLTKSKIKKDDVKFGISLRNVGPDMRFSGDGLAIKSINKITGVESTTEQRAASFNMPALLNIGGSYDFKLDNSEETYFHRLTMAANFTSNTFTNNQYTLGAEYGYKNTLMLRSGFVYEDGIFSYDTRRTAFTGFSAGVTVEVPLSKKTDNTFGLDYSFRSSNPFSGSHSIGIRVNLPGTK